ncbi:MurR/RpiR family transcriptional regulator [Fusobacterium sp. PH5-44]|uniref:MurR/RpiR family transcriptional regulator n=1 Tax=unclassified Fusobacterium TaxID=2648384 RepID=UPI003D20046C
MNDVNIIEKIVKIKDFLPKKQKILCEYIILNHSEIGLMSINELAEKSGVGTTTILRLTKVLDYSSFSDLKKNIFKNSMTTNISSYGGLKESFKNITKNKNSDILSTVSYELLSSIENFITPQNIGQIHKAVEMIVKAKRVNILGLRSSRSVASYLEAMLGRISPNVRQLNSDSEYLFDNIIKLRNNDILIVSSLWPCTKRTITVSDFCHKNKIPIILLTNTILNPIARYANVVIDTNSAKKNDGVIPNMIVAEAIVKEIWKKNPSKYQEYLDSLEKLLEDNDIFIWNE